MNHSKWLRCAAGILVLAGACAAPRGPAAALDEIAKRYVGAALQLAQHQPSLVDDWRGDPAWRPGPRVPVAETRKDIAALTSELTSAGATERAPERRPRIEYLQRQLAALEIAARRLLGERIAFADEVAQAFGAPLPAPNAAAIDAAKAALDRELPGSGSLGVRHAAFRRTITVPREREGDVLRAALEACRVRTLEHVTLPADESIDLALGVESPWDGFARYQGGHRSRVEIGSGSPLDLSRALRLACHEAYPGHHVQDVLVDLFAATSGRMELRLQPAFGPHLLIAEGAAEVGAELAFPRAARLRLYRDVLLPRAGLPVDRAERIVAVEDAVFALEQAIPPIIAAYLDSRTSREAALDALARDAAVMAPETLLAFAERQRARAVAYVLGRHVVQTWLATRGGDPWPHLTSLFSTRALTLD